MVMLPEDNRREKMVLLPSIKIKEEHNEKLNLLSHRYNRTKQELVREAISEFLYQHGELK